MAVLSIKKVPADAAAERADLCYWHWSTNLTACAMRRISAIQGMPVIPKGIRTKINYKESITLYIVFVNIVNSIYSI